MLEEPTLEFPCLEKFSVQINWQGVCGKNIVFREMQRLICEAMYLKDIIYL